MSRASHFDIRFGDRTPPHLQVSSSAPAPPGSFARTKMSPPSPSSSVDARAPHPFQTPSPAGKERVVESSSAQIRRALANYPKMTSQTPPHLAAFNEHANGQGNGYDHGGELEERVSRIPMHVDDRKTYTVPFPFTLSNRASEETKEEQVEAIMAVREEFPADNIMHHRWDAAFHVVDQGAIIEFRVCAHLMAAVSPVWAQLFHAPGVSPRASRADIENDPRGDVFDAGQGNIYALVVLLKIVHYQFDSVPFDLPVQEFSRLAHLAQRLECVQLLRPWIQGWIVPVYRLVENNQLAKQPELHGNIARIARNVGHGPLFRFIVSRLILSARVDHYDRVVDETGNPLMDMKLPARLDEGIIAVRFATIERIIHMTNVTINNLIADDGEEGYCKIGGTEARACRSMMLSSVLRALQPAGLGFCTNAATYRGSIQQLEAVLSNIQYEEYKGIGWAPHKAHSMCEAGLGAAFKIIIDDIELPLRQGHREFLIKQAKLSGVYGAEQPEHDIAAPSPITSEFRIPDSIGQNVSELSADIKVENGEEGNMQGITHA